MSALSFETNLDRILYRVTKIRGILVYNSALGIGNRPATE